MNMATLAVLLSIIYLAQRRYTSAARKETLFFFWTAICYVLSCLIVETGVSPPSSASYVYFVSLQVSLAAVCCFSLTFSGLSGPGWWEDGSITSMAILSLGCAIFFATNYLVAMLTFKGTLGPSLLFVLCYIINGLLLLLWVGSQLFVCFFVIELNKWAIGSLCVSSFFFGASLVLNYIVSNTICNGLQHYCDGSVFASMSSMFCYMFIYKYWEIVTFDDDEYYRYTEVVPGAIEKL